MWGEKLKTYFVEKYESREKEGLRHKGKTYVKSIKHKTKKNSLHFKHLTATEDSISYENTWPAIVCVLEIHRALGRALSWRFQVRNNVCTSYRTVM